MKLVLSLLIMLFVFGPPAIANNAKGHFRLYGAVVSFILLLALILSIIIIKWGWVWHRIIGLGVLVLIVGTFTFMFLKEE